MLNVTRWVAAFLVVLSHARNFFFLNYGDAPSLTAAAKAFYFISGFGHEAVIIFFVLSGYLVGGRSWQKMRAGTFSIKQYLVHRISRIYAVFIAAIALGFILDTAGVAWFDGPGLYTTPSSLGVTVLEDGVPDRLNMKTALANTFMLQTILAPTLGSNGPLWSLANEWWYYLLFPALFLMCYGLWGLRMAGALLSGGIVLFLPFEITLYFVIWIIGSCAIMVPRRMLYLPISAAVFAISMVASRTHMFATPFVSDSFIAISFALVINSLSAIQGRVIGKAMHEQLAGFSYSLYLCHFPVIILLASIAGTVDPAFIKAPPGAAAFAFTAAAMVIAYLVSYWIATVTEHRTAVIRDGIYRWLPDRPPGVLKNREEAEG